MLRLWGTLKGREKRRKSYTHAVRNHRRNREKARKKYRAKSRRSPARNSSARKKEKKGGGKLMGDRSRERPAGPLAMGDHGAQKGGNQTPKPIKREVLDVRDSLVTTGQTQGPQLEREDPGPGTRQKD